MLAEQESTMGDNPIRTIECRQMRLEAGMYGRCVECHRDIADRRLRLHPQGFAMRCQACEQRREQVRGHSERLALCRDRVSPDVVGSRLI
jgi:RNA polymerase-binding transcription factor DksA